MNMPPAARKAYMAFLLLAVGAYVSFLGYRGILEWKKYRERTTIAAHDQSELMAPLAQAVGNYAAVHDGQLPKDISITELLTQTSMSSAYFQKIAGNPQARLRWNATIDSLRQAQGTRTIILWLDNPARRYYAAALTANGNTCAPEIIPRSELRGLQGAEVKLK